MVIVASIYLRFYTEVAIGTFLPTLPPQPCLKYVKSFNKRPLNWDSTISGHVTADDVKSEGQMSILLTKSIHHSLNYTEDTFSVIKGHLLSVVSQLKPPTNNFL
jgi:hypothetical protein